VQHDALGRQRLAETIGCVGAVQHCDLSYRAPIGALGDMRRLRQWAMTLGFLLGNAAAAAVDAANNGSFDGARASVRVEVDGTPTRIDATIAVVTVCDSSAAADAEGAAKGGSSGQTSVWPAAIYPYHNAANVARRAGNGQAFCGCMRAGPRFALIERIHRLITAAQVRLVSDDGVFWVLADTDECTDGGGGSLGCSEALASLAAGGVVPARRRRLALILRMVRLRCAPMR
jgi:hypothetical protein